MLDHRSLVQSAYELEPLPQSLTRLAALVAHGAPDPEEIAECLAFDPVITAKVLRAANSTYSAPSRPVTRTRDAVLRLGPGAVFCLAVGICARPLMDRDIPGYGLTRGDLWRHSVRAALAAEAATDLCAAPIPRETFTAAMLHDLGKLVVGRFLTTDERDLLRRAVEESGAEDAEAESEILSLHHGEVGAVIAQHWRLPDGIVQGILHHHDPAKGEQAVCYATYLADVAAKTVEAGEPLPERARRHLGAAMERLRLNPAGFDAVCAKVAADFDRMNARYN
ncbi:MAG TPA: HDOD domain-containing protein [Gemmataceae bacterium]|nr:HDOD domain-containing protein [Gemmataceae bacterium]